MTTTNVAIASTNDIAWLQMLAIGNSSGPYSLDSAADGDTPGGGSSQVTVVSKNIFGGSNWSYQNGLLRFNTAFVGLGGYISAANLIIYPQYVSSLLNSTGALSSLNGNWNHVAWTGGVPLGSHATITPAGTAFQNHNVSAWVADTQYTIPLLSPNDNVNKTGYTQILLGTQDAFPASGTVEQRISLHGYGSSQPGPVLQLIWNAVETCRSRL